MFAGMGRARGELGYDAEASCGCGLLDVLCDCVKEHPEHWVGITGPYRTSIAIIIGRWVRVVHCQPASLCQEFADESGVSFFCTR
jgi:hypothetical protein